MPKLYNSSSVGAKPKILFVGFGDIASRIAHQLGGRAGRAHLVGVARSERSLHGLDEFWQGDIAAEAITQRIRQCYEESAGFDAIVITLTPSERNEAGYKAAYLEPVRSLLEILEKVKNKAQLRSLLFVSSTSVYAQDEDEWITEKSITEPKHYSGRILLETENLLFESSLPCSNIRFSGIYGEERDHIVRSVKRGNFGSARFTNRIRVEDCAGVLLFLLDKSLRGDKLSPIYLASDSKPMRSIDLRRWIAKNLSLETKKISDKKTSRNQNSKRCSNKLLLDQGYRFLYPSYKEGYCYLRKLKTGL